MRRCTCFSLAHFRILYSEMASGRILLEPHSSITFHHLRNKMSTIGHHGGRVTTKGVLAWTRRANQRQNQRMSHRTKRHQDHERGREERERVREGEHLHCSVTESCQSNRKCVTWCHKPEQEGKREPVAHSENNSRNRNLKKAKRFVLRMVTVVPHPTTHRTKER